MPLTVQLPWVEFGSERINIFCKTNDPIAKISKMRVVCTMKFVLGMDIDGDMEVESLGGLDRFARES